MMDEINQLLTIAEISVALAGFAGIIATFQFRQPGAIKRGHVLALSMIVNISLVGALFAVLPLIFLNYGIAEQQVWAICSALVAANISTFMFFIWKNTQLKSVAPSTRSAYIFFFVLAAIIVVLNSMNAMGLVIDRQFGTYFLSFVFCFFLVGFNFTRLLMLPLWKVIRQQETDRKDAHTA